MKRALSGRGCGCHSVGSYGQRWHAFSDFRGFPQFQRGVWSPVSLPRHALNWQQQYSFLSVNRNTFSTQRSIIDVARKINQTITVCGKNGDWMKILEIHQRDGGNFNAINYSTAMNQLAKITTVRRQHPRMELFMEGVTRHLQDHSMEWTVRNKVTLLHSIAKMGLDYPAAREAMHLILQDAVQIVEDRSPISVSLTAWSVATMNVECPELFSSMDRHASHLVKHGNSQTMANTVWACAKLQTPCPAFFRAVDEQAERLVKDGHLQAISIMIWAFATLRLDCPRLVKAVGERTDDMVRDGSSQNIANTAWAFATMGIESPRFFESIDQHPACVIGNGSDAQAIANTAWAFATLNVEGYKFFRAVDDECARSLVQKGTVQHLAMTLWAFASLRIRAFSICGQIEEHATSIVSRGNPQNIPISFGPLRRWVWRVLHCATPLMKMRIV